MSLTYTHYFGEFSYSLDMLEDGVLHSYKRGAKPFYEAIMGFDFNVMYLSFGAMKLEDLVEGYKDDTGVPIKPMEPTYLPRFGMGFNFEIYNNTCLDIALLGIPDDILGFNLKLNF